MYKIFTRKNDVLYRHVRKILLIMRLIILLLTISFAHVNASSYAQKISIDKQRTTLEQIFNEIKKQAGYDFIYDEALIKNEALISLRVKNASLKTVLDQCFEGKALTYSITDNIVVIKERIIISATKSLADVEVKGKVLDAKGNPIARATVTIKGTKRIVLTNEKGEFNLGKANEEATLIVTHISFKPQELPLKGKSDPITIILQDKDNELSNIIISTGYQKLSQRELASAVTQVKIEDIALDSKLSVDQMLAGKIPGLMSLQTSGEPGATPKIRIRGTSSIIGGSAPLWVLDDIILENPVKMDLSNLNSPDARYLIGNAIAGINARDIETITVLKDASATAIYGSRAANGVIVVTTKKGRVGKPQINYSGSASLNQRVSYDDLNLMNAGERIRLSQEIIADNINYGRVPRRLGYEGLYLDYLDKEISYDQFKTGVKEMSVRNTDWYNLLFRNSITNNQSVNVSGGSDRTTYYGSLSYSDMAGTAKGSSEKRYSGMAKINSWTSDNFFIGFQINASNSQGKGFHSSVNPNKYAYETSRTIPAFNKDGSEYFYPTQQRSQEFLINAPKEDMMYNIMNETRLTGAGSNGTNITAQLNLEYRFLNGFKYRFLGGFDQALSNTSSWAEEKSNYVSTKRLWNPGILVEGTDAFNASPIPWGGIISNTNQRKSSYTLRNGFEYSKVFKGDHLLNGMVAQEIRSLHYKGFSSTNYGWQPERGNSISPTLTPAYLGIANSLNPVITDNIANNLSWLGTATYSYKDKITFNGNIRADGSNNFGSNPKYRFLPTWSLAAKYTISNEPFMENSKVFSYLAIRGSYGLQGNIDQSTSPDLIIQIGAKNAVTSLNESYIKFLANPDLRWEKTKAYNIGFDFSFFSRKKANSLDVLSGTIDIYAKKGTDIIVTRQVSQVMGLDQVKVNGGRVNNSGIEGSLRLSPFQTRDFSASINLIASYNKNTMIEANKELNMTNNDKLSGNALVEGKPIGSFYSYPYAGLNGTSGYPMFYNNKGDARYDLYINEISLIYSGVNQPDVSGGFDLSLRYKNWYANLGFQYALGGTSRLPNFYRSNYYAVFDALANTSKELGNRWRAPGDEKHTNIPVLYDRDKFTAAKNALNVPSQFVLQDYMLYMYDRSDIRTAKTDNLRLRNININYMVPQDVLKKLGVQSLSFSFQAENVFLYAKDAWQGKDPESGDSNTPLPKVYTIGINAGF